MGDEQYVYSKLIFRIHTASARAYSQEQSCFTMPSRSFKCENETSQLKEEITAFQNKMERAVM